jgi:hypothetical protein
MSFVATRFPLPSVTGRNGAIVPFAFAPGRCAVDLKRGIIRRQSVIRPTVPRTRLSVMPASKQSLALGGFFDSLFKFAKGVTTGVVAGAAGGPAGMIAGGVVGGASSIGKTAKGAADAQQQAIALQQQQLGPLAGVSTGVLVASLLGGSALLLVLARSGGR